MAIPMLEIHLYIESPPECGRPTSKLNKNDLVICNRIYLKCNVICIDKVSKPNKKDSSILWYTLVECRDSRESCMMTTSNGNIFRGYWPFVRGIQRSPVNSPHKGQWRGALMFSLICSWINGWVNNREAGDLRRHRAHYDVIVMEI